MKVDIKGHINMAGTTKLQKLRQVLTGLQDFYLDELKKTQERLENIQRVVETPGFNNHKKSG